MLLFLLSACAQNPPTTASVRPASYQNGLTANQRLASLQLQLKSAPESARTPIYLALADAYTELAQYENAAANLAPIDSQSLNYQDQLTYLLIKAELLHQSGKSRQAVGFIPVDKTEYPLATRLRILDLQARVLEAAKDPTRSIDARLKLTRLLSDHDSVMRNAQTLLANLENLSDGQLAALGQKIHNPDLAHWVQLAQISRNQVIDNNALSQWLFAHPNHSVPQALLQQLQQQNANIGTQKYPAKIALLLPDSGDYAKAGAKIKQGFMDAYLRYQGMDKPEVKIYSSTAMPLANQLENIIQSGAQMLVGPLTKEAVAAVNASDINMPVLAFNRMDIGNQPRGQFYQFGLIPEDEAQQAAQFLVEQNLHNVAIITPDNILGLRVAGAFAEALQNAGGTSMGIHTFAPDTRDFAEVVRSALGLENKHLWAAERNKKGRGAANYRKYIQSDLQAIYMIASNNQGRGIIPQLRFYDASYLPVVSTSQVFNGKEQAALDADLNGVIFSQPSWLQSASQYSAKGQIAPNTDPNLARFSALGFDAYNLIPHLAHLLGDPGANLQGKTGVLNIDPSGVVHRQLNWAYFKDGLVENWPPQEPEARR